MTRARTAANDNVPPKPTRRVTTAFEPALPITDAELRLYETHCAALIQRLTANAANDRLQSAIQQGHGDAGGDLRAGLDETASRE